MSDWQWPDPAEDGPACSCSSRGRLASLFGHDDECPAAGVPAPAPVRRPGDWQ